MTHKEIAVPIDVARQQLLAVTGHSPSASTLTTLLRHLSWDRASARTLIASHCSTAQATIFDQGGKAQGADTDTWLIAQLTRILERASGFVLVEDWLLDVDSPLIARYGYCVVSIAGAAFHVAEIGQPGITLATMNLTPRFQAFVIEGAPPACGEALTAGQVEALAQRLVAAYCGVDDGESYLLVELQQGRFQQDADRGLSLSAR